MAFTWSEFVTGLNAGNIVGTLSAGHDNVQLRIKLGGPMAQWGTPPDINGTYGNGTAIYDGPEYLKITNGGPDYGGAFVYDLAAVSAYADVLANHIVSPSDASIKYADYNNVDQTCVLKGVATTSNQLNLQTNSPTTDTVFFEIGFQTNPDATDPAAATNGYPGYFWINQNNGAYATSGWPNLDEYREGLIDDATSIDDPAFDGSAMRFGVWVKRNGSNYDCKVIANGVAIASQSIAAGLGLGEACTSFSNIGSTTVVTDTEMALGLYGAFTTSAASFDPALSAVFTPVTVIRSKYAAYAKPNPANTDVFNLQPQLTMLTNPAMAPLSDGGTAFWQNKIKCTETDA